jgi:hercynine metabolism small protein
MESIAYQLHNFYGGIEELLKVIATHCENNIATRSLIMESTDQSKALRFQFHQRLEAVYREICDEVAAANLPDGEIARLAQLVLRSRHEGLRLLVKAEEMDEYYALYPEAEEDAVG